MPEAKDLLVHFPFLFLSFKEFQRMFIVSGLNEREDLCLQRVRVALVLGLPYQEGYPTCLVKALLGITRLPAQLSSVMRDQLSRDNLKGVIQFLSQIINI